MATGYLKVATPELVALDLFKYPDHAGGLNHIATVFSELIETLNPIKLIDLAKNTNSEYQLQRIHQARPLQPTHHTSTNTREKKWAKFRLTGQR